MATAYRAIQNGSDARFVTAAHLADELSLASQKGKLREALAAYTHPGVLVVDEVGHLSLGTSAANALFQVVNDRSPRQRPRALTTNKPVEEYERVLLDPDLAEAILDRLLERGRVLSFKMPSYRTRDFAPSGIAKVSGKASPGLPENTRNSDSALRVSAANSAGRLDPTVITAASRTPSTDRSSAVWHLIHPGK